MEVFQGTATECHLPYGITQCYLLPRHKWTHSAFNPSHAGRYSIYLPRRDGRLSWPSWLHSAPAGSRTSDLSITSPTLIQPMQPSCLTVPKKLIRNLYLKLASTRMQLYSVQVSCESFFSYKPEILSPRGQSGLEAKNLASASVSASKLWPRPRPCPQTFGLGLASVCSRRTSSQEEIDGPICLHFTLQTTGHHTMIEDILCERENEK